MAKKKSDAKTQETKTPEETKQSKPRNPTIQITCTAELKAESIDLAKSYGLDETNFWLPIIEEYITANREQINQYRNLQKNPVKKPSKPPKKNSKPKKTDAATNTDNNPTTAQGTEDKAGDDNE